MIVGEILVNAFRAVDAIRVGLDTAGTGGWVWGAIWAGSWAYGIRHVIWHVRHGRVSIGTEIVGSRTAHDHSGATIWRSARRVDLTPSLSPFYRKSAALIIPNIERQKERNTTRK